MAKQQEEEAREKHENEEREYRRQLLIQRVRSSSRAESTAEALLEAPPAAATLSIPTEGAAPSSSSAVVKAAGAPEPLQHINFWSEDEARLKAEHPDVVVSEWSSFGVLSDSLLLGAAYKLHGCRRCNANQSLMMFQLQVIA